jgi:hypothetical protein
MKRKYNTLNEEISRMKSLFGESRLYGNLVGEQEENIISEQWRFFNNPNVKGFRLGGKSVGSIANDFSQLGKYTEFLGVEVKNIEGIINHLTKYSDIWVDILGPKWNMPLLNKNLLILQDNLDSLKGMSEEVFKKRVMQYFPQMGGMQNMVEDMWRGVNDQKMKHLYVNTNTPVVKGKTDLSVVIDPKTNEIILSPTTKDIEGSISTKEEIDAWAKEADIEMESKMVEIIKDGDGKVLFGMDKDGNRYVKGEDGKWRLMDNLEYEEGMIKYDIDGKEVGVYNKNGELIDSNGNIVDEKGNIITKVEDIVPEAKIVTDASANGTPSQMDGKTFTDANGNLEKVENSFRDAQQKDGGLVEEVTNLNEQAFEERKMAFEDRKMAHEERMKDKTLSAEDKALKQREMDLAEKKFAFEVKQYEDALKEKKKASVDVTGENIAEVKKTFREKIGLTGKYFDFIFWPLSIKEGDHGLKRIAKQTGSAVVDPLGVLGWFRQFSPPNPKLVYAPKNANWHRAFRGVFGTGFNLMLWNIIMWKGFNSADYRIDKILPTYWKNIKNNWATQVGRMFLHWVFSGQFTEMCQELKDSSGKDCNEWLTGYGDDIEKHLKSYVDGKKCDELKAMRDSNGNLERVEYGNAAKYITGEYNKEMKSHIGAGWIEDFMEWAMGWKTDITNLTADAFETYEIDVTNGGGKTEKFNAIDYYFAQALMEKCGAEYQEKQTPVEPKEVVVEGGGAWG